MKIIDFDEKFYEFTQAWMRAHPNVTVKQVENRYNELMDEWVNTPADWLDGATPDAYFDRFETAEELIGLMRAYHAANVSLPEPLYARIANAMDVCKPSLLEIVRDESENEELRAEAISLLGLGDLMDVADALIGLVLKAEESNELSEIAAERLAYFCECDPDIVKRLLKAYPNASDYAQGLILEIACNYPGDDRIYTYLMKRLKNKPDDRALNASLLEKLGDARAIPELKKLLGFFDLRYLDYIEIRNAVEALGGDPGEERTFYGDPDYEALRNME